MTSAISEADAWYGPGYFGCATAHFVSTIFSTVRSRKPFQSSLVDNVSTMRGRYSHGNANAERSGSWLHGLRAGFFYFRKGPSDFPDPSRCTLQLGMTSIPSVT